MLGWFKKKFSKTEEKTPTPEEVAEFIVPAQETEEDKPQEPKRETQAKAETGPVVEKTSADTSMFQRLKRRSTQTSLMSWKRS